MPRNDISIPDFTPAQAEGIALRLWALRATAVPLGSYADQNFLLTTPAGDRFVLKLANTQEMDFVLEAQNQALLELQAAVPGLHFPKPIRSRNDIEIEAVMTNREWSCHARLLTYIDGDLLASIEVPPLVQLRALGRALAEMDGALMHFYNPACNRYLQWDLMQAATMAERASAIRNVADRRLVLYFLARFEQETLPVLRHLRQSVIHNDANDANVLVADKGAIAGFIDFGDMVFTATVCEVAIAATYAMLGRDDGFAAAAEVIAGYHAGLPLQSEEIEQLYMLLCARLCISVVLSAEQKRGQDINAHALVSEKHAWRALRQLIETSPERLTPLFFDVCKVRRMKSARMLSSAQIGKKRRRHIGKSLSVSYRAPLRIVRGALQYLYDDAGRTYLDAVNNVSHVGHCHPRVVRAGQAQMARLNTNTRYLHEHLVEYAERLTSTLPSPLRVCFFVCSGSEANDLALRMARTVTGRTDIAVLDGAYHGTTIACIEASPYKFAGRGGAGSSPHVHNLTMPDGYRGTYKHSQKDAGERYARDIHRAVDAAAARDAGLAAFICESLLGCGGQIELPAGYLKHAFKLVRAHGGLCIADEVQVGFGRVGSHFWGFETQEVVPDIVTLGKPIGNGHPMAAVVTTPEIADAFANGMEYFNTFGGNPVSCAIGLAVLDVIQEEKLQENAARTGGALMDGLRELGQRHALVGDVRGRGLFAGVELVRDRSTLEPAAEEAAAVVDRMKEAGVLVSTDGPLHNVLKIKPPIIFDDDNAGFLIQKLDDVLGEISLEPS